LRKIELGQICCVARDLQEPSSVASEILNARPYAFLDNAPLEERRTQAIYTRRASESGGSRSGDGLGILDAAAIEKVQKEAWPEATTPDELHDALMLLGVMTNEEAAVFTHHDENGASAEHLLKELIVSNRATKVRFAAKTVWAAAERLSMIQEIYPGARIEPELIIPDLVRGKTWERANAIRELLRGRIEVC